MKRVKTSQYKGVSCFRGKWRVRFKSKVVGIYDDELTAAKAYNDYSTKPNQLAQEFVCTVCQTLKPKEDFVKNYRREKGVSSICRKCFSIESTIRTRLRREKLSYNKESLGYLKIDRIIKLIEKGVITKDEGRDLYNRKDAIKRAYAIRLKGKESSIASNSV